MFILEITSWFTSDWWQVYLGFTTTIVAAILFNKQRVSMDAQVNSFNHQLRVDLNSELEYWFDFKADKGDCYELTGQIRSVIIGAGRPEVIDRIILKYIGILVRLDKSIGMSNASLLQSNLQVVKQLYLHKIKEQLHNIAQQCQLCITNRVHIQICSLYLNKLMEIENKLNLDVMRQASTAFGSKSSDINKAQIASFSSCFGSKLDIKERQYAHAFFLNSSSIFSLNFT
jgi:hypothetical protein